MPIFKIQQRVNYAAIPNDTLRDKRLSIEARGTLSYLLTHSDTFDISLEFLQKELSVGRDKLKKIVHELKQNGYLSMTAAHNKKGNFAGQEWFIYAESQGVDFSLPQTHRPTEKPSDGKTDGRINRQTENTSGILKEKLREKQSLEEKKSLSASASDFENQPQTEQEVFTQTVVEGLKDLMNTPFVLPSEFDWLFKIENAWRNEFSAEQCLETFELLEKIRKKKKGKWQIKPQFWEANIPRIETLRLELEELENGNDNRTTQTTKQIAGGERVDAIIEDSKRFKSPELA